MGRRQQPRQWYRNPECLHYKFCLSVSALLGRRSLHCSGCPHQDAQSGHVIDQREVAACCALLAAVFCGLPEGFNQSKILDAYEDQLDQVIRMMAGDRSITAGDE